LEEFNCIFLYLINKLKLIKTFMNYNYIKIFSGSLVDVISIKSLLENENISPVIKDMSESARLAGFGIITDFNQEVFIHPDQLSMANRILKNYLDH